MKILVTGGSGLLGKSLQKILPSATYVSSSDANLMDYAQAFDLINQDWDHVIHAAAKVGGILDNAENNELFYRINSRINSNVLKAARLAGTKRLTGILSTCIYPEFSKKYPMKEEQLLTGNVPKSNAGYATAKRELAIAIDQAKKEGFKWNYLIPCNLYGPGDSLDPIKSHFVTALLVKIAKIMQDDFDDVPLAPIKLLGDGTPLRQFMLASDLAKVISIVIEKQVSESFNVAPPENLSIRQITEVAIDAVGYANFEIEFDGQHNGQHRKDVSTNKMYSIQHFKKFEFTPLRDGIRETFSTDITRFGYNRP